MPYLDKQVFNIKERHGISAAQSREHQRAWSEKAWAFALEKGNYDLARQHLNYEIVKGGKIQPIDKSKSMPERMAETLATRAIKDPNATRKNKNIRTVVDFVFSGSPDQMHKLAFGDQQVTIIPGNNKENLDVRYTPKFEQWTKDIYKFVCDHWGEENIIGFYVHGDESTPHVHATIVPVKNNRIDFKGVFVGDDDDKLEFSRRRKQLHTELAELNEKYGLKRGSDISSTKSKHMQSQEWRRRIEDEGREKELALAEMDDQLSATRQELKMAETRVKGLKTMIANQEAKKAQLEKELKELNRKIANNEGDRDALEKLLAEKSEQLENVKATLADKQEKLADAEEKLVAARNDVAALNSTKEEMQRSVDSLSDDAYTASGIHLRNAMLDCIISEYRQQVAQIPPDTPSPFDGTLLELIGERGMEILHCARLLMMGLIDDATTFAETHGGGGGGNNHDFNRDDDEDDRRWRRRCVSMACRMMRPAGRVRKR